MEKHVKTIIGIDVSKRTFDLAVGANSHVAIITKACLANNLQGYAMLDDWLEEREFAFEDILFCLENTGLYHRLLASYLLSKGSLVWVETPVEIKWSMGIQRGKSDQVDAERIYTYAFRNQDKINPYEEKDKSLQQIADYMALRERLLACIKTLQLPVRELKSVGLTEAARASEKASARSIASMKKELEKIDEKIMELIEKSEDLAKKYKYATSVRCVGFVAASYLLIYTNGFTRFNSAKQLVLL
ncbi:MAG: transposase [Bacteroidales bacterium]|nr:transposase [Bacteroidales bacterium]MDT8432555.1 transposase [Bacteroidales bacterium]